MVSTYGSTYTSTYGTGTGSGAPLLRPLPPSGTGPSSSQWPVGNRGAQPAFDSTSVKGPDLGSWPRAAAGTVSAADPNTGNRTYTTLPGEGLYAIVRKAYTDRTTPSAQLDIINQIATANGWASIANVLIPSTTVILPDPNFVPPSPGLPNPGPWRLFNATTSPPNVGINWDTAVVDNTHKMTLAMIDPVSNKPYAAIGDSGCALYWTTSSTPGRLTVTCTVYNPGTYTNIYCPQGVQPSAAGTDDPMQIVQPDGSYIVLFSGTNSSGGVITWNGNQGTIKVEGYIKLPNWQTATGWPVGTTSSYVKEGFTACGAEVMSGAITPGDKQLGYIAHALAFLFNNNGLANGPVAPATRQDGNGYPSGNTYYHQGQLLAIVPASRGGPTRPGGLSAWDNAILDALENYGAYVMDRTGGFTMRVNPKPEPGITATLTSADFNNFMSMTSGSLGKFIFDNVRILTGAKPSLAYHL
jgi:hypothetical protein